MSKTDALLEDIFDRLKSLQEGLDGQKSVPENLKRLEEKVDKLQEDMTTVKTVIPAQSGRLHQAEADIRKIKTQLELA